MLRRTLLGVLGTAGAGGVVFREELIEWTDGDSDETDADASGDGEIRTRGESQGTGGDSEAEFEPEAVEAAIVEHINDERFAVGVPNLGRDSGLRLAAREHSRDMHERDFFAHRNPDGEEPWHRAHCEAAETLHQGHVGEMQNQGSDYVWDTTTVGEAAAYVVEGWALSDGHYDIMIDGELESVGVGVIERDGEFLVTAKYC